MNSPFIAAASMDITQKGLAMRKGMDNCSQQVKDNVTHIIEKHHPSKFTGKLQRSCEVVNES